MRTRDLILEQSKQLFLELGYGGTRIENITEACGISRAGFYTYFPSKRDVFLVLGETTYREISLVVDQFENLPNPCGPVELDTWVRSYFEFMDMHGAFMLGAAQTGPRDEDVRETVRQLHPRTARRLGKMIRAHQSSPHGDETAMGLTVLAMLDRAWYFCHGARFPVDEDALIATVVEVIVSLLGTNG
jgi:TetR/AcrR family transcriptional regulator